MWESKLYSLWMSSKIRYAMTNHWAKRGTYRELEYIRRYQDYTTTRYYGARRFEEEHW